jgi:hypothetical protein
MTETAPNAGEHEGSIPSYYFRLFGTGVGDCLQVDCARKFRPLAAAASKPTEPSRATPQGTGAAFQLGN